MQLFYEETCGSFIIANKIEDVKIVLDEIYEIDNELKIYEIDIKEQGHFVPKKIYEEDYSFGDIVNLFKDYADSNSYNELKIIKTRNGYRFWKTFEEILNELNLNYKNKIEKPFELFCAED